MRTGRPYAQDGDIVSPYMGQVFSGNRILRVYRDRIVKCHKLISRIRCTVLCVCGATYETNLHTIVSGKSSSCGCRSQAALLKANSTHGYATHGHSRTYRVWRAMKDRTLNPHCSCWDDYGGRGIILCERWQKFENFLEDMGECPESMTLDRVDVNGNYCPENCRWASSKTQANNRRTNVLITFNEKTLTLAQWADFFGVPYHFFWKKYREQHVSIAEIPIVYARHIQDTQ